MYVTLQEAKKQLNVDESFHEDDGYIVSLIQAAEDAVAKTDDVPLKDSLVDGELPPSVKQSVLILVANFYANREPVGYGSPQEVPYTFKFLYNLNRNFTVG